MKHNIHQSTVASLSHASFNSEHEVLMRHVNTLRWTLRRHGLDRIIRDLRSRCRQTRQLAEQVASRCG